MRLLMRRRRSAFDWASSGGEPVRAHAGTPRAISRRNSAREIEAITTHDDQGRIAELAEIYSPVIAACPASNLVILNPEAERQTRQNPRYPPAPETAAAT